MKAALLLLAVVSSTVPAFADHTPFTTPPPSRGGLHETKSVAAPGRAAPTKIPMDRGMGRYLIGHQITTTKKMPSAQATKESRYRPYRRGERTT